MNTKTKSVILLLTILVIAGLIFFYTAKQGDVSSTQTSVTFTAILPLTGHLSHLGENERIGMSLALEDAKREGNATIAFNFDDSAGRGSSAVTVTRKRLDVDGDRFFIVATTGPVLATRPLFRDLSDDKLVINQTMYPGVTEGYPFSFRLFPSSQQEAELLAQYAITANHMKVAALHISNEWGTESVNVFRNALEAGGGTLTIDEVFTFADKDFRTILNKIIGTNPDALLIYAYPDNFPTIMKQFSELGKPLPILANADFAIGTILAEIPSSVLANTVFPAPRYLYDAANPAISQFNERVRASGHVANFDIATFYDMTMILNKAVATAKDTSPAAVRDALSEVFPYDGVTGHMELTPRREILVDFALSKWVEGKLTLIK